VLAGYNAVVHRMSKSSYRRQMLTRLDQLSPATDCLFLGNSLVEAGCDLTAFSSAWPAKGGSLSPVNLALGGTSPVEHYLILDQALRHPLHPKYVIYGFFDDQLNAPPRGDWSDLVGNRAFAYYFPEKAANLYAPGSRLKEWQLRATGRVPLLAERSSLWGKVEMLRRRLEDLGMPRRPTNRFGRVEDFAALEAKDVPAFVQRCGAVVDSQTGFSQPIREILRLARARGAKVFLVEMPMPARHRQVFYSGPAWSELHAYLLTLAGQEQAVYVSASDWVKDDANFEDATHLNEQGAKIFSARLAAAIAP
jgi:hypothetical protein